MLDESERELLGQRLKELRQTRRLSAAQVAELALGYRNGSHVAVSRLERAQLTAPRQDHLRKLAAFFKVEPAFLMAVSENSTLVVADTRHEVGGSLETTGQRLRHLRVSRALDTDSFAQALRQVGPLVLSSDVEAWERDERYPNPVQLSAICRFTECAADWLQQHQQ